MDNPKISIIIPTYNHGKEIAKCLDSVFAQTLISTFNKVGLRGIFEIIIVNDGSTDKTEEILKNYCRDALQCVSTADADKIKIINQKNQGAPMARNNGFKESKGEYVIFLDADIELRKDALEKMLDTLGNNPTCAYVYSDFKFGFKKFKLFPFDGKKLRGNNYIHTSALIRREAFPEKGFDQTLKKFQDWDLWLTMLENGYTGVWIPEVLFTAKPRKNGMSEWLPKCMYRIPWAKFGIKIKAIEKYEKWREVVMKKHGL